MYGINDARAVGELCVQVRGDGWVGIVFCFFGGGMVGM